MPATRWRGRSHSTWSTSRRPCAAWCNGAAPSPRTCSNPCAWPSPERPFPPVSSRVWPSWDGTGRCAVYFADWQFATDHGEEYLDPVRSQYKETIFLIAARYLGEDIAYCPFIFVDQDVSLMRGLIQGWPKQFGTVWITRAAALPSKAAPTETAGGKFGATLSVRDHRVVEARVTLQDVTDRRPSPTFARAVNVRYFPVLEAGKHDDPAVHELVQLRSRNTQFSTIWTGEAALNIFDHPHLEIGDLAPISVGAGFRFSFAFTVDDVVPLKDLRKTIAVAR